MLECWDDAFSGCEPIVHRMKRQFVDRWVRFHSLPESKRYPESERDYCELLARHNAVLGWLTGHNSNLVLLTTECSWNATPSSSPNANPERKFWRSVAVDEAYWHVWIESVLWCPGFFDPLVRQVANDEIANVMICEPNCHWVLHPYDGGMDVIATTPADRDRIRSTFPDWLSKLPSGL